MFNISAIYVNVGDYFFNFYVYKLYKSTYNYANIN